MMEIKILGGDGEIGGNKILIDYEGTRIMLDFGMSFKQLSKYYSEFLQPRKCSALADFFEFGLLPEMKGAYRQDYLEHMDAGDEERGIDALFLSHAHADHAQYIHFLRPDIPIYATRETRTILDAIQRTGSNPWSELIDCCETFKFYTNKNGGVSRVSRRNPEYIIERPYNVMESGQRVDVGPLTVELVRVDHSLPGACAFIVYSPEGNLVYTGDIRFHGTKSELSLKFVEKARDAEPTWMISEGTRIGSDKIDSEQGVRERMAKMISGSGGTVFLEHPIKDMDRVESVYRAAESNGRELVVGMKLAYLIDALGDDCPISLDDVRILVPKKSWGLISKRKIPKGLLQQDYETWERGYLDSPNAITCEEIRENQKGFAVSMNFWEMGQLTDMRPDDGLWIKSSCEPFCEEMELDEKRKGNWLEHFGIRQLSAHASGHASGIEIREMIKSISPKKLIPVHTEHPEMLMKCL